MKFTTTLLAVSFITAVAALPHRRDVNPALAPQLGFTSGRNPTGTGDCDGAVDGADGQPIKIPCACPPDQATFDQALSHDVAAGHAVHNPSVAVSFPTDGSVASQITRLQTAIVTLQNLHGPGQGCPAVSTTFSAQLRALQNGGSPAPSLAPTPAPSQSPTPSPAVQPSAAASGGTSLSASQIDALAPQFGHASGVNPTGTGNCDGAVNGANGKPIQVPCACPPPRSQFISSLAADIAAGHAVNNPTVGVQFPTDNSPASQRTRIQAALVALQNLNGSGKGCPASSTTFSAQLAAIQG
jgi:hypothetical protein